MSGREARAHVIRQPDSNLPPRSTGAFREAEKGDEQRNTRDGFSFMEEDRPTGRLLLHMETQALHHVGSVARYVFTKRNKTTEYTSFIVSSVNKNE